MVRAGSLATERVVSGTQSFSLVRLLVLLFTQALSVMVWAPCSHSFGMRSQNPRVEAMPGAMTWSTGYS